MSTRLRIDAVELMTTAGPVRYDFAGPLTVLAGPVGVGKSTLLELIKHAIGGSALFSPVVTSDVRSVTVDLSIGESRLALSRPVGQGSGQVSVYDRKYDEPIGRFPVEPSPRGSTLGMTLMQALGLPTDVRSTPRGGFGVGRSSPITFNDVWSFIYVEQPEIDRSIAHNRDTVREPKRRATFELLFGLTDETLLKLRADLAAAHEALATAEAEERTVRQFLRDARTESRESARADQERARQEATDAERTLERLRTETDPADAHTDVLRDLLAAATERAESVRQELIRVRQSQEERQRTAAAIRQDQIRLTRLRDASGRLAEIEFVVCPRCHQSIRDRDPDEAACRLCLQPEPSRPATTADTEAYEQSQLDAQSSELAELLDAGQREIALLISRLEEIERHAADLSRSVDERTRELVSPRLRAFSDASIALGRARERVRALDETLRLWDRATDLARAVEAARVRRDELDVQVRARTRLLDEHRELLVTMSADYQSMIAKLGVPSVRTGRIDDRTYLPVVDGKSFDKISTGGIRTALIVGYWVTVLATALREPTTLLPGLLILDSPRKSIGAGEALAGNLYRQLDVLAENYRDRVQIIVADNGLPAGYSRRWQQIDFDYDHPVISTLPHPGPARVQPLHEADNDRDRPEDRNP